MVAKRQDVWLQEEDNLLVETILRFIEEGKTQVEAFEEVGEEVKRTSAACGYRWNSVLRKKHIDEINQAKEKGLKKEKKREGKTSQPYVFEEVLLYLQSVYQETQAPSNYEKIVGGYKGKINQLEEELSLSKQTIDGLQQELTKIQDQNKELTSIVGNVREMVVVAK